MSVGFTTIYAINTSHHYRFEFEPRSGEVYSIQHYVIKFVSDLRQVDGFLRVLQFPPPIKLVAMILLKVALNTKIKSNQILDITSSIDKGQIH